MPFCNYNTSVGIKEQFHIHKYDIAEDLACGKKTCTETKRLMQATGSYFTKVRYQFFV